MNQNLRDVEYAFFSQLSYLNWNDINIESLEHIESYTKPNLCNFINNTDIWNKIKTPQYDKPEFIPNRENEILMYNEEDKRLFGVYGTEFKQVRNEKHAIPTFDFDGWQFIYSADSVKLHKDNNKDDIVPNNGFFACAFMKDNDIVIAYRGTNSDNESNDWTTTNIPIGMGNVPFQLIDAALFYEYILKTFGKGKQIHFTGHSLGGCLAQSAYAYSGKKHHTVTWNGLGFGDSFDDLSNVEFSGIIKDLYRLDYTYTLSYITRGDRGDVPNKKAELDERLLYECRKLLKGEVTEEKVKLLLEKQLKNKNDNEKLSKDIYRLNLLLKTISKYIKSKDMANNNIKNYYTAYDLTPNLRARIGSIIEVSGVTEDKTDTGGDGISRTLKQGFSLIGKKNTGKYHSVNDFLLYINEETGNIEIGKFNTSFTKNLVKTVFDKLKTNEVRLEIFVDKAKEYTDKENPFIDIPRFACKSARFPPNAKTGIEKAEIKYEIPSMNSFPTTSEFKIFAPYKAFESGEEQAHDPIEGAEDSKAIGIYTLGQISNVTLCGITGGKESFLYKITKVDKEKTNDEKIAENNKNLKQQEVVVGHGNYFSGEPYEVVKKANGFLYKRRV